MGRGSSSSRGSSRSSSSSGRGSSRSSWSSSSDRSWRSSRSRGTTVIWYNSNGTSSGSAHFSIIPLAILLIIFGAIAMFVGVSSIFSGFKYSSVSAECVDNDFIGGWYYTTYEYEVDGVEYTSRSTEGWELPEIEGKIVTIYYLKDDPSVITEENQGFSTDQIVWVLFGVAFIGGGIGLIFLNKKMKAKKQLEASSDNQSQLEDTPSDIEPISKTKCKYCGTSYDSNEISCPSCGAKNND